MQQVKTRSNGFGTDSDLRARIGQALQDSGYPRLRSVTVDVESGNIILRGRVPSYYFKQVAQTVAMNAAGLATLRNDVDVA